MSDGVAVFMQYVPYIIGAAVLRWAVYNGLHALQRWYRR